MRARYDFKGLLLTWMTLVSFSTTSAPSFSAASSSPLLCKDLFQSPTAPAKKTLLSKKTRKYKPRRTQDYYITVSEGRQIFLQLMPPAKPDMPTLLMMPGGYRSWLMPEEHMQALAAEGYGIATFNLSVQPLSVATLKQGAEPAFLKANYTLKDFAYEIEFVAEQLASQGYKNIVPVSLSLSSMMAAQSEKFDFVIDTSPVTSTGAQIPQLEEGRRVLKAMELANPFFGPAYTRSTLDKGYRDHSEEQIQRLSEYFVLPAEKHPHMLEGFVRMWRAAEGYTWASVPPQKKQRHVFVIGSEEQPTLLKHQLETFRHMLQTEEYALLYFVEGGDHFLPVKKPTLYVQILSEALQLKEVGSVEKGIVIFDEKTGTPRRLESAAAVEFINSLLSNIK